MKKLGTGHIWFSKKKDGVGYQLVSLSNKEGNPVTLDIGTLGAYNKVRLWVEVLK